MLVFQYLQILFQYLWTRVYSRVLSKIGAHWCILLLTHRGRVTHPCVSNLGHDGFRRWLAARAVPSHCLNHWWLMEARNKFRCGFNEINKECNQSNIDTKMSPAKCWSFCPGLYVLMKRYHTIQMFWLILCVRRHKSTEAEMSFWWGFRHWLHRRLAKRQLFFFFFFFFGGGGGGGGFFGMAVFPKKCKSPSVSLDGENLSEYHQLCCG